MSPATRTLEQLERDRFLGQAENLARLIESPGWEEFMVLLSNMRLSAMEEMARSSVDQFAYWQGVVGAIAEIMDRPQAIVTTAAAVQREEEDANPAGARLALRALMNAHLEGDL